MYQIAQMVLILWLPLVLVMFVVMPTRLAVVIALIASWLFLPELAFPLPRMPDYTKSTATSLAILLGALMLDPSGRIFRFKPSWVDLPIALWCIIPFFSSVSNQIGGTGLYDGMSVVVQHLIWYGAPWLIGRLYFTTAEEAKTLALGILLGGAIYVPLCLYEVRMSPQLHRMFYGFATVQDWLQVQRWGGYRPSVFLRHGLAVGVWMATATAMAFWFFLTGAKRDLYGVPMWLLFGVLLVTTILVKSTGAILIMGFLMAVMLCVKYLQLRLIVTATVVGIVLYLGLRITGVMDGSTLTQLAAGVFGEGRASSLEYRLLNENVVVEKTSRRPLVGWGGWGRSTNVFIPELNSYAVPDSLWINMYGRHGVIGLSALYGLLLLPAFLLFTRMKPSEMVDKRFAAIPGLALVSLTYSIDGLFNAMVNPVFIVTGGAVSTLAITWAASRAKAQDEARQRGPAGAAPGRRPAGPPPLTTRRQPSGARA